VVIGLWRRVVCGNKVAVARTGSAARVDVEEEDRWRAVKDEEDD
jgi:hypothetical protein